MTHQEWEDWYCNVCAPKDFAEKLYKEANKEDAKKRQANE